MRAKVCYYLLESSYSAVVALSQLVGTDLFDPVFCIVFPFFLTLRIGSCFNFCSSVEEEAYEEVEEKATKDEAAV